MWLQLLSRQTQETREDDIHFADSIQKLWSNGIVVTGCPDRLNRSAKFPS